MSFEQIKEVRNRIASQLENAENSEEILELTLEEISLISGGALLEWNCFPWIDECREGVCYQWGTY